MSGLPLTSRTPHRCTSLGSVYIELGLAGEGERGADGQMRRSQTFHFCQTKLVSAITQPVVWLMGAISAGESCHTCYVQWTGVDLHSMASTELLYSLCRCERCIHGHQ